MAVKLNFRSDQYNQVHEYQIEGITYIVQLVWNSRAGWQVSINDKDDNPILSSLTLVPSSNITWRYGRGSGLFSGDLLVGDNSPEKELEDLTIDNFGQGKRYELIYLTSTELDELGLNPRS